MEESTSQNPRPIGGPQSAGTLPVSYMHPTGPLHARQCTFSRAVSLKPLVSEALQISRSRQGRT